MCDSTTGNCVRLDLCAAISCPMGSACDLKTGNCISYSARSSRVPCDGVRCPQNYQCEASTGLCVRQKLAKSANKINDCPANSHYTNCGSPCPYTCNNVYPSCSNRKCAKTCQCNDGFVQVSVTNSTCVPAKKCANLNVDCKCL
ncbi:hypothetical protein L596_003699 [Steinernema carpocapsae]|uniref:TIL domain-containing protein n=1 Tax=Steinernema carpocapsae TaxID=34508 RepID=A0A4V6I840_STECR|nr:hypothetical protein L596_003699 [Steinernema carpocapsae]